MAEAFEKSCSLLSGRKKKAAGHMALAGHVANKNVQPSMSSLWSGEIERRHLYNSAFNMTILVGYDYGMVIVGCKTLA
ncbi:hypothetical protein [Lysinibacillus sp. 3P01SB]|uniref:hypothetical protein n=1 Tax=Lysinibacillus sp. 3P01SB TaxID=3132284 RepID=UPI0039A4BA4A